MIVYIEKDAITVVKKPHKISILIMDNFIIRESRTADVRRVPLIQGEGSPAFVDGQDFPSTCRMSRRRIL